MKDAKTLNLSNEDIHTLEYALANENELIIKKDVEGLLDLYAEDATILTGSDLAQGKESIRESIVKWFSLYDSWSLNRKALEVIGMGDMVAESGILCGRVFRRGLEASDLKGKYVLLWRRMFGEWKLLWEVEVEDS
jgi:ketosteroid isomerase-like protein